MIIELLGLMSKNITQLCKAQDREFSRQDSLSSCQYDKIAKLNDSINNSIDTYLKLYQVRGYYNASAETLRQIEVLSEAVERVMEEYPKSEEVFNKWGIVRK